MGDGRWRDRSGRRSYRYCVFPLDIADEPLVFSPFRSRNERFTSLKYLSAEGRFLNEVALFSIEFQYIERATRLCRIAFAGARSCARVAIVASGVLTGPILKEISGSR